MNKNETLPENLQGLLKSLHTTQAVPLGQMQGIPFLAMKLAKEQEHFLKEGNFSCEMKASFLNIDFGEDTVGLCFVQIRLNENDDLIRTAVYDLKISKQFDDAYAILAMQNYGVMIASEQEHDFLSFESRFEADFQPRAVLEYTKEQCSEYKPELFTEITFGLLSQVQTQKEMWDYLNYLAPFEKSWYGRMKLQKVKNDA